MRGGRQFPSKFLLARKQPIHPDYSFSTLDSCLYTTAYGPISFWSPIPNSLPISPRTKQQKYLLIMFWKEISHAREGEVALYGGKHCLGCRKAGLHGLPSSQSQKELNCSSSIHPGVQLSTFVGPWGLLLLLTHTDESFRITPILHFPEHLGHNEV